MLQLSAVRKLLAVQTSVVSAMVQKADFIVMDLSTIEMTPARDVIKNVVYSGTRHSVSRVYVEGECIVRDGKACELMKQPFVKELQEICEAAWKVLRAEDGRRMDEIYPMTYPRYV